LATQGVTAMNQFKTQIHGIPCICRVSSYTPAIPTIIAVRPEDSEEGSEAEFYYEILDLNGVPYMALNEAVTDEEESRLIDEWELAVLQHKHYMNEPD
jgi:hypothetical protein